MIVGISKRQWLLILIAVAIVLLINFIGMWLDIRRNETYSEMHDMGHLPEEIRRELWFCDYPWSKIILESLVIGVSLGALAWLVVYTSRRAFFQGLSPMLKYGIELLVAVAIGAVFAKVSIGFSEIWVDDFWCGRLYGLLKSFFVYNWSRWVVFPATSALVFCAMYISGGDRGEKGEERRPTP